MSNLLNLIAHNVVRLVASGLPNAFRKGLSVKMIIMYAWKYGFRFLAVVTKAKVSFSIGGYLSSTPLSARDRKSVV